MPSTTFTPTGSPQTLTVPAGVTTLTVDAVGGGGGMDAGGSGGKGGRVKCDIAVTPGETLTVHPGNKGGDSRDNGGARWGGPGGAGDGQGGGSCWRRYGRASSHVG